MPGLPVLGGRDPEQPFEVGEKLHGAGIAHGLGDLRDGHGGGLQQFAGVVEFVFGQIAVGGDPDVFPEYGGQPGPGIAQLFGEVVDVAVQQLVLLGQLIQPQQRRGHVEQVCGLAEQNGGDQKQKGRTGQLVVFEAAVGIGVGDLQQDLFDLVDPVHGEGQLKVLRAEVVHQAGREGG